MGGLDHERLKKRMAGSRGGGWRTREGDNRVRILPPHSRYLGAWELMEDLAVPYKIHFFKIEGRPTEVSLCLETNKQRCPACEAWRLWRKSEEDPGLKERARQIAPADQYLFNLLDINNLKAGIQVWTANYTCWQSIMEIASNAMWGNVVDPANGINFLVRMTPGNRTRSGFNAYSVMPEPEHTTVMEILQSIPDWQAALDTLDEHISDPKEPAEIQALLDEIGFPPPAGRPAPPAAPAPMPAPLVVAPAMRPAAPVVGPAAVAAPAVRPVGAPGQGRITMMTAAAAPAGVAAPHYDPGPAYQPKVSDAERPAGAPRCFGDYNPAIHRCQPCPVLAPCQMKLLGIS